jgi:hypothetical protein
VPRRDYLEDQRLMAMTPDERLAEIARITRDEMTQELEAKGFNGKRARNVVR